MINTEIQIQIQRSSTGRLTNVIEDFDNDDNDSEDNNDEDKLTCITNSVSKIVMRRQNIFRI